MPAIEITSVQYGKESYKDGSYMQFKGHRIFTTVSIGAVESSFDAPVKYVRFKNEEHVISEMTSEEKRIFGISGFWDFKFIITSSIMGQVTNNEYQGKFEFETEKGTRYEYDNSGGNFIYNKEETIKNLKEMENNLSSGTYFD